MSNATIYGSMLALDSALAITYNLYTINFACYYGAYEASDEALMYTTFTSDPSVLLYNIVLNFGLIYDAVKDIITFFAYPEYCKAEDTYSLGYQIGQFVYLLFDPYSIYGEDYTPTSS
jgi:hypothetical protein